jgi:hypothetical protein
LKAEKLFVEVVVMPMLGRYNLITSHQRPVGGLPVQTVAIKCMPLIRGALTHKSFKFYVQTVMQLKQQMREGTKQMSKSEYIQGLPSEMGLWKWVYSPDSIRRFGYTVQEGKKSRIAVHIDATTGNYKEEALPVRAIYNIRKNPTQWEAIEEASLARRDIVVKENYTAFAKKDWKITKFQFSTGAYRYIKTLNKRTNIMVSVTGIPADVYSTVVLTEDDRNDDGNYVITRTVSGYSDASYLQNPRYFKEKVFDNAYTYFEYIYTFNVMEVLGPHIEQK